ncbi:MAG: DoxX family protein [Nanoarchaeota archaeon]|nr:DoxX family protein [Nanoarchaeota archaeon]
MDSKSNKKCPTYTILRILLGALMLVAGIVKLMNPAGPIAMLTGLGFPMPIVLAWVLLLSEIIFGICLIIGYKVKYTVWPLVIVLIIACITVTIPGAIKSGSWTNTIFHLVAIAGMVHIGLNGAGPFAIDKRK